MTAIEWTQKTWNPIRGCSRVSAGCRHCYAETFAARFSGPGQPYEGLVKLVSREVRQFKMVNGEPTGDFRTVTRSEPHWTGKVRMVPEHLADPLRWRKPRKVFVNSMSDLFHESLSDEKIAAVFGVMAAAPRHTFQILTKRAERMLAWSRWMQSAKDPITSVLDFAILAVPPGKDEAFDRSLVKNPVWPLPNVWLGVSAENQECADERIPELLETPASVRWVSLEPLLGPIDISEYLDPAAAPCGETSNTLDWVVTGCESGRDARPAKVDWFRSLRDQCAGAGVPYFLKQATPPPRECECDRNAPAGERCTREWVRCNAGMPGLAIACDEGSKRKNGVIGMPYLDGVQHSSMPEVTR